ncbi:MAG: hypothetical protein AB1Z98_01070 [Nannocystaceae bacterium]
MATTLTVVLGGAWFIAAAGACGGEDDGRGSAGPGIGSVGQDGPTGSSGDAGGTAGPGGTQSSADGSAGDGASDTDGVKFDIPPGGDVMLDDGCAAVDFLFVIDNSISMQDQQDALKAAFPEFITTIETTLPTTDYHIMVADTDADGRCSPGTCSHSTCQEAGQYACGAIFDACDTTRGAGVVHPAGQGASNTLCTLAGGNRYIEEGQPDLEGTFDCIASVGLAGNASERPLDGMVEAVSGPLNAAGGCNEGFVRDEAILVVTFVSDDPNVEDQNSAQQAYDAVVAAKNGNADAIVMLGLINGGQAHWVNFISMFGARGIQADVNGTDYNQFFLEAVGIIEDTCLDFEG